jgi:formyl-CoA transferase
MFDAMAEWMTVPLLHGEGGAPFKRIGLAHAAIAPYGVFKTRDGADILIAIQNDREWRVLAEKVLGDIALASDPKFATNPKRVENRSETDAKVSANFARHDVEALMRKLESADIAFARVNDWELLSKHPHLRRITVGAPSGPVTMPAPAPLRAEQEQTYGPIPALGEHTERIKAEFGSKLV